MANYKRIGLIVGILLVVLLICVFYLLNSVNQGLGVTGNYCYDNWLCYKLQETGIDVRLHCKGYVAAGADLGTGRTIGVLRKIDSADSLQFYLTTDIDSLIISGKVYQMKGKNKFWEMIGYLQLIEPNMNELDELKSIIFGASEGPKGTCLKGQSIYIEVVKTEIDQWFVSGNSGSECQ